MSFGNVGGNYTDIRDNAISRADQLGNRDKHVRKKEGGNTLYFHDSKSNKISSLNPFKIKQRNLKRRQGADEIKESINRQFNHFRDSSGRTINVGDLVFKNINSSRHRIFESKLTSGVTARDFADIDREIANVLEQHVGVADKNQRNEALLMAKGLRLSAMGSLNKALLPNLPNIQREAQQFRDAVKADVLLSGQSEVVADNTVNHIVDSLRNQGANPDSPFNRLDVDLGVNHRQIDAACGHLESVNVTPVFMNEMRQMQNLKLKKRYLGPQMQDANTRLKERNARLAGSNDPGVKQMRKFVRRTDKLLAKLPTLSQSNQLRELGKHVAIGKQVLENLRSAGDGELQVAHDLEDLLGAANEQMLATLPMGPRYDLSLRPNTTPPTVLDTPSPIYDKDYDPGLGNGHMQATDTLLHAAPKGNDVSVFSRQRDQYDAQLKQVESSLAEFRNDPSDQKLGVLMTNIHRAEIASDRYIKALGMAGRRLRDPKTRLPPTSFEQTRIEVAKQRRVLQKLGLQANTINDRRNFISSNIGLPNAHQHDQKHGVLRGFQRGFNPFQFGPIGRQAQIAVNLAPPNNGAIPNQFGPASDLANASLPPQPQLNLNPTTPLPPPIPEIDPNFIGVTAGDEVSDVSSNDAQSIASDLDALENLTTIGSDSDLEPGQFGNIIGNQPDADEPLVIDEGFDADNELAQFNDYALPAELNVPTPGDLGDMDDYPQIENGPTKGELNPNAFAASSEPLFMDEGELQKVDIANDNEVGADGDETGGGPNDVMAGNQGFQLDDDDNVNAPPVPPLPPNEFDAPGSIANGDNNDPEDNIGAPPPPPLNVDQNKLDLDNDDALPNLNLNSQVVQDFLFNEMSMTSEQFESFVTQLTGLELGDLNDMLNFSFVQNKLRVEIGGVGQDAAASFDFDSDNIAEGFSELQRNKGAILEKKQELNADSDADFPPPPIPPVPKDDVPAPPVPPIPNNEDNAPPPPAPPGPHVGLENRQVEDFLFEKLEVTSETFVDYLAQMSGLTVAEIERILVVTLDGDTLSVELGGTGDDAAFSFEATDLDGMREGLRQLNENKELVENSYAAFKSGLIDKTCLDSFGVSARDFKRQLVEKMGWDPKTADQVQLEAIIGDGIGPSGVKVKFDGIGDIIEMSVSFYPKTDNRPGEIDLGLARLEDGKQGTGLLANLFLSISTVMKPGAFTKATMTANITVGGYAWARYGFVPTEEAYRSDGGHRFPLSTVIDQMDQYLVAAQKRDAKPRISQQKQQHIKQLRDELTHVVNGQSQNFGIIRKIAALDMEVSNWEKIFPEKAGKLKEAYNKKKKMTLGKALLLQTGWKAEFQLEADNNRKSDMPYLEAYLGMRAEQSKGIKVGLMKAWNNVKGDKKENSKYTELYRKMNEEI